MFYIFNRTGSAVWLVLLDIYLIGNSQFKVSLRRDLVAYTFRIEKLLINDGPVPQTFVLRVLSKQYSGYSMYTINVYKLLTMLWSTE